ncbi:23903_t:CDS:2, partial [Gigaspora rosea]
AHSTVLRSRSLYFQRALSERWNNKELDYYVFTKPNITPSIFEIILDYIYTENIIFQTDGENSLYLLTASDEFELLDLMGYVQEHLIKNHSSWLLTNLIISLNFVCQHSHFQELYDAILNSTCRNPYSLFKSDDFPLLENIALEYEDIKNWSDNQFTALKETISPFIPLIRYYYIPKNYINEQIKKYRLDSNTFIKSKTSKRGYSRLLSNKNKTIISSWIDQKGNDYYNNLTDPYSFKLLLRGSKDGWDVNTFHELCDFRGPTITILKVKETGDLIGGYNPTSWARFTNIVENYEGYFRFKDVQYFSKTSNSFIFSFTNSSNPVLSRINTRKNEKAVWSDKNHGPCFGTTDLCMGSRRWISIRSDYRSRVINLKNFTIEEYEVLGFDNFNQGIDVTLEKIQESIFYYAVKGLNFKLW